MRNKKAIKQLWKKALSLSLSVTLVAGSCSLSGMTRTVNAAETETEAGSDTSANTAENTLKDSGLDYDYARALQYSMYFYDANMCGTGVSANTRFSWRGDCHTYDAQVPLQPMDAKENGTNLSQEFIDKYKDILDPDGDGCVDVAGGFHDAGDHVKFGMPENYSAATLGWGYYEFRASYTALGQDTHIETLLRYFNDYLMKCTFRDADGAVIAHCYQVGDGDIDHSYWEAPEVDSMARPAYFLTGDKPQTDYVVSAAASLTINYLNFKDTDPQYAAKSLDYAKALWDFANSHDKELSDNGDGPKAYYYSNKWEDDYCWAGAWLYLATGDETYLDQVLPLIDYYAPSGWCYCWNDMWSGAILLLGEIDKTHPELDLQNKYREVQGKTKYEDADFWLQVDKAIETWMKNYTTPGGYAFLSVWGSARYNTAMQLVTLVREKYIGDGTSEYAKWAESQMKYIMGDNPLNRCYIVGYNEKSVRFPHHRAASGLLEAEDPRDQKHVLYGALAGGPDGKDQHNDTTADWIYNEVTIDYNAAFVGACAGLYHFFGTPEMAVTPDFPPVEQHSDEEGGGKDYWVEAFAVDDLSTDGAKSGVTKISLKVMTDAPEARKDISVRYFFNTSEVAKVDGLEVKDLYDQARAEVEEFDGATIAGPIKYDKLEDTYYAEIKWDGYAIANSGKKYQFRMGMYWGDTWDPTNDYSYQDLPVLTDNEMFGNGNEKRTERICVYADGVLVGGIEPDGTKPEGTLPQEPSKPSTPTTPQKPSAPSTPSASSQESEPTKPQKPSEGETENQPSKGSEAQPSQGTIPSVENPSVENPGAEKPSAENPSVEKPSTGNPSAGKPSVGKPSDEPAVPVQPSNDETPSAVNPPSSEQKPSGQGSTSEQPGQEPSVVSQPSEESKPSVTSQPSKEPDPSKNSGTEPGVTPQPSENPTPQPSQVPSTMPSREPSAIPSQTPSTIPSQIPSVIPSQVPSAIPSQSPSVIPSQEPSTTPSQVPSTTPSQTPSAAPSQGDISVRGVVITTPELVLKVGESNKLKCIVVPQNATNQNITWSTKDTDIISIDAKSGEVTARAVGQASVTATSEDGAKTSTCIVNVQKQENGSNEIALKEMILKQETAEIEVKQTVQIEPLFSPSNATNCDVNYTVEDTEIASVDKNGFVTAKKAGSTVIYVVTADGKISRNFILTVKDAKSDNSSDTSIAVEGISVDPTTWHMYVGAEKQLNAYIRPINATNQKVVWTTKDNKVLQVLQDGTIRALQAGTATVTVMSQDGGFKASCDVVVEEEPIAVEEIEVSKETMTVTVGKSSTLTAEVSPTDADNTELSVKSNGSSIKVTREDDTTFKVKGVKPGTATITFTAKADKNITKKVTVKVAPAKVSSLKKRSCTNKQAVISWKSQTGVSGYEISLYDKKTKKRKTVGTTKKNTYTLKKLKSKNGYKVKVRAYYKKGSTKIYGSYSSETTFTTKK